MFNEAAACRAAIDIASGEVAEVFMPRRCRTKTRHPVSVQLAVRHREPFVGARCVQAVVSDLLEAVGQDVVEEATEKFDRRERRRRPILRPEGHCSGRHVHQTTVRDGDSMRVAPEVPEHVLGAAKRLLRINEPRSPRKSGHEATEESVMALAFGQGVPKKVAA